jgi:hypothetical protein
MPYDPSEVLGQLTFAVDPSLQPALAEVDGLVDGDAPRSVARLQDSDGSVSDLVVDEVLVSAGERASAEAFAARWNGAIIDVIAPTNDTEATDYLVRIDPSAVDAARGPDALLTLEPHQPGEMRFGSDRALRLIAVAAIESAEHGLAISPNWIAEGASLEDGSVIEAYDAPNRNALEWSYMRDGGEQDIGVAPALQFLASEGKLDNERVRIMINDGGFYDNPDFPAVKVLRKAQWGDVGLMKCTGGALCPWHGSQVTMTAMGQLDNEYGVAGPAGPVAELVAVQASADSYKRLKTLRDMVDEHRPDIVNMSYGTGVTVFRSAASDTYDRNYKDMTNRGALLVAAAGNDGRDIDSRACIGKYCYETLLMVPCESTHVLCVGGMKTNSTWKADGSNFGSRPGSTSVQLYAPFCVRVLNDPGDPFYEKETKNSCGTSFSSPFVAGVAGLLKAAEPSLSPGQLREILLSTAHHGGVHFEHVVPADGQLRLDAMAAVERVLGSTPAAPDIRIDSPADGSSFPKHHWFELEATATSFAGGPLPVHWHSSLDGELGTSDLSGDIDVPQLSEGDHVLTATATDLAGQTSEHWSVISVRDTPPTVKIGGGLDGNSFYDGNTVDLFGMTQDLEYYGPLPDDHVRWEVRRNGSLVHEAEGHIAAIPGYKMTPGSYEVTFIGEDNGHVVEDHASFTVKALPLGEDPPQVYIDDPVSGAVYGVSGAHKAQVHLVGSAHDPQDGWLSGTRFRWTATSQAGTTIVLCEGSNLGGGGGQQFVVEKDCSDIDVELDIDPAVADLSDNLYDPTLWTITLTAYDSSGIDNQASVAITVQVMVG